MKRAVLADIHANLAALEAVLADARALGADEILCLGDVIGYGPRPAECLRLAQQFAVCLLGNHEHAALLGGASDFDADDAALAWTRQALRLDQPDGAAFREFLGARPRALWRPPWLLVHGSPRSPLFEYVFPEDCQRPEKFQRLLEMLPLAGRCLCGHTHIPGVFLESGRFVHSAECAGPVELPPEKVIINVGSVGQPRDGDPRACYLLWEDDTIEFRRAAYPLEQTLAELETLPEFARGLAERLRVGR